MEGFSQGHNVGYSKLLDTLGNEAVLLPDVHMEDCAGPGYGVTRLCWFTPMSGGHEGSLPPRA